MPLHPFARKKYTKTLVRKYTQNQIYDDELVIKSNLQKLKMIDLTWRNQYAVKRLEDR